MQSIVWIITSVMLMFGVSACTDYTGIQEKLEPAPSGVERPAPADTAPEMPAKNRPKSKVDTIELEGMENSFQFTLHDDPELQFSTYIVEDLLAEEAPAEEDASLVVYANFAGQKNEDAKVVFFTPKDASQTTVREEADSAKQRLAKEGFTVEEYSADAPKRFTLSESEFHISKQKENGHYVLGTVLVFEQDSRIYSVTVQYPEDWAEGFMPRVHKMFEDIVWYAGE